MPYISILNPKRTPTFILVEADLIVMLSRATIFHNFCFHVTLSSGSRGEAVKQKKVICFGKWSKHCRDFIIFHKILLFFFVFSLSPMIKLSCFHPLKNLPAVLDSLLCYFFSNLTIPLFYLLLSYLHERHPSVLLVSAISSEGRIPLRRKFLVLFFSWHLMCTSCSAAWGPLSNLEWTCSNMTLAQRGSRNNLLIGFLGVSRLPVVSSAFSSSHLSAHKLDTPATLSCRSRQQKSSGLVLVWGQIVLCDKPDFPAVVFLPPACPVLTLPIWDYVSCPVFRLAYLVVKVRLTGLYGSQPDDVWRHHRPAPLSPTRL